MGRRSSGGGSLRDLQLDMGAGELSLTGVIVGEGELNLGVGQVRLNLLGGFDKYTVEMNKGIGDLIFNGESINGRTVGNGATEIEINGGIGSITVNVQ